MTLYIQPYQIHRMARRWAEQPQQPQYRALDVNVSEQDDVFVLSAFVPGLKAEDLNIQVLENVVSIEGEYQPVDAEYLLNEIPSGSFRRTLRLPTEIQSEKVEAKIADGVLTLSLPKAEIFQTEENQHLGKLISIFSLRRTKNVRLFFFAPDVNLRLGNKIRQYNSVILNFGAYPVRVKYFLTLILVIVFLSACGGPATETIKPPTAIPTNTPLPTATMIPTPSTPLAILVLPADMDKAASDLYQKTVYDLAQQSAFRFQVRNVLAPTDLADPTLKVVIVLPPDPGVVSLASTAPGVQFLAVNIPNLTPGGNLSVLSGDSQVELPAFLAGYVAAMVSDEYHIGMVIPKDNADGQRAFNAFNNGMIYYCGLCRTFYISTIAYPTYVEIPADEDPKRYGGYANVLINDRKVYSIYIYPTLADADFLSYIGTQGVMLIGTSMPDPRPGGWVMSIRPDTIKAIQTAWPNLIAGQGGVNVQSPLGIADADPSILTPGKLRLAQKVLEDLLAGRILPTSP